MPDMLGLAEEILRGGDHSYIFLLSLRYASTFIVFSFTCTPFVSCVQMFPHVLALHLLSECIGLSGRTLILQLIPRLDTMHDIQHSFVLVLPT